MSVESGQTLSHYRLLEKIGEGGMGVVWSAEDTVLRRKVAIKILPEAFSQNAQRLARFEREARLLAVLNHPNVAAIYGLEESDGVHFLVLEMVPGESLAQRLKRGPLAVDESFDLCRQVAEGLEAAHAAGVIHRDLKPGNVQLTPDGKVKVLDFGLAKVFARDIPVEDLSHSPTLTDSGMHTGTILGTAPYMSPEQARGRTLDKRTDIWSFGCVLYECLTGRMAFRGQSAPDVVSAILQTDPDWSALPERTPPRLRNLLERCLEKNPRNRLHDIADARIEIEALGEASTPHPGDEAIGLRTRTASRRHTVSWSLASLIVGATVTGVAAWMLGPTGPDTPQPVMRFSVSLPADQTLPVYDQRPLVALSPDGKHLVYVADHEGTTRLYLRELDQLESRPLPGTEGGSGPFFSPDSQWVGFFTDDKLKKISLAGGAAVELCAVVKGVGASWRRDDTIVFPPNPLQALFVVQATGGVPQALTSLDHAAGENSHRWPSFLPDGNAVLFSTLRHGFAKGGVAVLSLQTGEWKELLAGGSEPKYTPTGLLVYKVQGTLMAVSFDRQRLEVAGSPVPVLDGLLGAANYSFSETGTLVYVAGDRPLGQRELVWVDRQGRGQPVTRTLREFEWARLSPDGTELAVWFGSQVWVYEIERDVLRALTFESSCITGVWSPDGKRIAFSCLGDSGQMNLFWKLADGSGDLESLTKSTNNQFPSSFSPDGRWLAFTSFTLGSGDIWVLPVGEGEGPPKPFLQTPFREHGAVFSPDGRWLAYTSNESGNYEIYVQPYPGPGGKRLISAGGGEAPLWAPDGKELYYRNGDQLMAVSIQVEPAFSAGTPQLLFGGDFAHPIYQSLDSIYDVTSDGQRFVMVKKSDQQSAPAQINVVLNWFDELERLVPTAE